jgi:hypothetical protein
MVALLGVVQVSTSPAGATACADVIVLRTMTVHIKPVTHDYKIGTVAKVPVNVTRPAPEDPLQQGVPVPSEGSQPAANATVGVGLHIGPVFAPGYAKTDANGDALVPIKIPSYAPAATVNVDAYAYNIIAQAPCYTIQEDGYARKMAVFKTIKP